MKHCSTHLAIRRTEAILGIPKQILKIENGTDESNLNVNRGHFLIFHRHGLDIFKEIA